MAFAALTGCEDDLVEDVPTSECASGKRWVGELTPSEEMYPGRDCVDCHEDNGGPELLAGGTVYGVLDPGGMRTSQSDCFGVEGAHVRITTGDGQVLETTTNRAGNFFFEGRESSLVKPFSVTIEYTLPDGTRSQQPMTSKPSYGGCARCHNGSEPMDDVVPGSVFRRDEVADAYPLFTGPVHQ